jgi:hypothetical protein
VKKATIQQLLLGKGSATDTNATIPEQQAETAIIGCGVFYTVRAEML